MYCHVFADFVELDISHEIKSTGQSDGALALEVKLSQDIQIVSNNPEIPFQVCLSHYFQYYCKN